MLEYRQILADLKERKYKPIYVLMGEEAYFIDLISNYIADTVLDESEREFNQTIIYGKDATAENIIANVRSYPMMANHRVVIIREAQQFKELDKLEAYFLRPVQSTIFVICHKYGSIDRRKKFFKSIEKNPNVLLYNAEPMTTEDVIGWIVQKFRQRKIRIEDRAAFVLTELLGNDLHKLANEIEKMVLLLPEGSEVRIEEVTSNVGMSREYNVFELQSALANKNVSRAFRIVHHFARNPNAQPLPLVLGTLYSYFSKLLLVQREKPRSERDIYGMVKVFDMKEFQRALKNYPFPKLVRIMGHLHECDLRSKGVNNHSAGDGALLTELVYKILN